MLFKNRIDIILENIVEFFSCQIYFYVHINYPKDPNVITMFLMYFFVSSKERIFISRNSEKENAQHIACDE